MHDDYDDGHDDYVDDDDDDNNDNNNDDDNNIFYFLNFKILQRSEKNAVRVFDVYKLE